MTPDQHFVLRFCAPHATNLMLLSCAALLRYVVYADVADFVFTGKRSQNTMFMQLHNSLQETAESLHECCWYHVHKMDCDVMQFCATWIKRKQKHVSAFSYERHARFSIQYTYLVQELKQV